MSLPSRAEVCVGALVVCGRRILLLRRSERQSFLPGLWDIPGGRVRRGEALPHALVRELREETGLPIRIRGLFQAWTYSRPDGARRRVPTVEIDFLRSARARRTPRLEPREHSQYAWASARELRSLRMHPALRALARRALRSALPRRTGGKGLSRRRARA